MAIKDRRLFANGGEATSPIVLAADTGSGFVPSNKKVILEQEGDSFFAVTTEDGIVLDREQINIDLSPNRDPVDAYRKQEYNKNLGKLTLGLTGLGALPFLPTKAISRAGILGLNALKYAAPIKNIKLKPASFPLKRDKSGKLMGRNPNNPFSYTAEIKPLQTGVYTAGAALTAQNLLEAEETEEVKDPIQQSINELVGPTPPASPEVVEDQIEVLENTKEDVDTVIDRAAQLFTEDALDQPETIDIPFEQKKQGEFSEPAEEPQKRTRGFFNSPEFLSAVRNIGKALVVEGQFGPGLAKGIVLAGEETRREKELEELAEQEQLEKDREFLEKIELENYKQTLAAQLKGSGISSADAKQIVGAEENFLNAISSGTRTIDSIKTLDKVISLVDSGATTGLKGLFGEYTENVLTAIGQTTGKKFDELSPRMKANALLNVLRQKGIREILGEAGKTISNLDRQIVEEVFGKIDVFTPPAVTLDLLKKSRDSYATSITEQKNKIIANKGFFDNTGLRSGVFDSNQNVISNIINFDPTLDYSQDFSLSDDIDSKIYDLEETEE